MSYVGVGVSPGNVPVYHGTDLRAVDRKVRLAELILRCVICVFALAAVLLIAMDSQVQEIFTIQKKAKFTDMKALVFLVVVNGMATAYSLGQALRCGVGMVTGSVLLSKPLAWFNLSCDQSNKVIRVVVFTGVEPPRGPPSGGGMVAHGVVQFTRRGEPRGDGTVACGGARVERRPPRTTRRCPCSHRKA